MTTIDPLAQLHDIHLPRTINWEAIPWSNILIIALLFVATSAFIIWLIIRYRQKKYFRREALKILTEIEQQFEQDQNSTQFIVACNQLLRRLCLTRYPADQVASLTGESWLNFLNEHSKKDNSRFNTIEKKLLTDEMYQPEIVTLDSSLGLAKKIRLWIKEK